MGLDWTADWTAEVKARMHTARITARRLADECGYSEAYLSLVLSGKKESKCSKTIILSALDRLEAAERVRIDAEEAAYRRRNQVFHKPDQRRQTRRTGALTGADDRRL